MADFYVKYGSKSAHLLSYYKCGNVNLKLHKTKDNLFVLSKNRRIIYQSNDPGTALHTFHNAIYLDQPGNDLFTNLN